MERLPHLSCPAQVEWVDRHQRSIINRLASWLSEKRDVHYSKIMGWIYYQLKFALLRASLMCTRGARFTKHCPILDDPIDLQLTEGHLY